MTTQEVRRVLAMMDVFWPGRLKLPDGDELVFLVETWQRHLGDVSFDAATAAVESFAAREEDWPPPPGRVRSEALRLTNGPAAPDADEAWGEVLGQLSAVGSYGTPRFSSRAVGAAVESMGWMNLCKSENAIADRAHFLRIYGTVAARAEREAVMPASVHELLQKASGVIGHRDALEPIARQGCEVCKARSGEPHWRKCPRAERDDGPGELAAGG